MDDILYEVLRAFELAKQKWASNRQFLLELVLIDKFGEGGLVLRASTSTVQIGISEGKTKWAPASNHWLVEWNQDDLHAGRIPGLIKQAIEQQPYNPKKGVYLVPINGEAKLESIREPVEKLLQ